MARGIWVGDSSMGQDGYRGGRVTKAMGRNMEYVKVYVRGKIMETK